MTQPEVETRHQSHPGTLTMAAFIGAVVIGGGNFIGVAFSNQELDPLYGAALRFGVAGVCFFAITLVGGYQVPRGRAAVGAAIYGLLGFGLAYGLLYFAIDGVGAGTTSVMVASAPLATLVLAVMSGQERFTPRGVIGGLLVIVGFAVLSLDNLGAADRPVYLIAGFLGTLSIAGSSVAIKGYPQAHPVTSNAIGMTVGAIILAAGSLIFQEQWTLPGRGQTWLALLWLVGFGSVGLFILFLYVIQSWTASGAVYAVTLMPVVAIPLAALMLDEKLTLTVFAGAALVIAAVYIGALGGARSKSNVSLSRPREAVTDSSSRA